MRVARNEPKKCGQFKSSPLQVHYHKANTTQCKTKQTTTVKRLFSLKGKLSGTALYLFEVLVKEHCESSTTQTNY